MKFQLLALLFVTAGLADIARADFLINPSVPRTVIFDSSQDADDEVVPNVPLGFNFNFYGETRSHIDISTNGNLNFSNSDVYTNPQLPANMLVIAPLWDDHYIYSGSGQSIYSQTGNTFFSVTWDVSQFDDTQPLFQFQATIFGADTTIGNFQFLKDDIVFSYNLVTPNFYGNNATVGLTWVDTLGIPSDPRFASLPGDADGFISDAQVGLLPTGPGDAILFRVNGNNYDSSIIHVSPVPEPTSMGILSAASVGAIGMRMWRRKRAAK